MFSPPPAGLLTGPSFLQGARQWAGTPALQWAGGHDRPLRGQESMALNASQGECFHDALESTHLARLMQCARRTMYYIKGGCFHDALGTPHHVVLANETPPCSP